jgi:hypothetical protein
VLSFGTDSGNKHVTYYFRHQFPVPDPAAFTNALVRLLVDDGAVVYVNGVAVIRRNMPSGPINYLTLASTTVGSADETNYFHVGVRASEFVAGINTLAVEVHQAQRTSGDVSFDLEMIGQAPPPAARLEAGHNDTSLVLSWPAGAGAFVLETTPGLNGEPWVAVTNAVFYTNRLFRTSVARGGIQQFFRLRREP